MAEKIVSPGVFTRENDLSYISQGIGEIGAVIIGPFKKGPAFLPIVVNTQSEFENIFGTPDGTYYTGYTVQNYLREAGTVTIVKVGHLDGYEHIVPYGIVADGTLISSLFATTNGDEAVGFTGTDITANASSSLFNISGSDLGVEISSSIDPTDSNNIGVIFGTSPYGSKNAYAYTYFENAAANVSVDSTVTELELGTQDFTYDTRWADTPWIQSQDDGSGNRHNLFRVHTLSDGTDTNTEFKVSIFNVKAGKTVEDWGTFSLMIRKYDDTDSKKSIVETYSGLTLDDSSPNHIARVIGDIHKSFDTTLGKFTETGDWKNYSKHIRVTVTASELLSVTDIPFAHGAYLNPIFVDGDETIVPAVVFTTGSADNSGTSTSAYSGIDLDTIGVRIDNGLYNKPIPVGATVGANVAFGFDTADFNFLPTGSVVADVNKRQFTVSFQEGFDGISPTVTKNLGVDITATNSQGFDMSTSLAAGSVAYQRAIDAISSPDEFDINLVATPGVVRRLHPSVFDSTTDMVEAREDAFYIGDVTSVNDTIAQSITQGEAVDSNYVGTYYPWVKLVDANTNRLTSVPPSVLMPGIYASNDKIAAEWFAPAGLNRGGIVGAVSVLNRLTHAERDELYEGKINPIATFPGEGIVAFGQKTLQDKASALDRINVRRLLIKVKKFIASTSRYLIFEQNDASTRNKFTNTVNPYLEGIQQRQGLYTFKVVMDETNNTPDMIDRNFLVGQIYLQPTKTAEFIVLDFNILPTGASFNG